MTPSTLADALQQARTDWLHGQREAWTRYAACLAQVRALEHARAEAPSPPRRLMRVRAPRARA